MQYHLQRLPGYDKWAIEKETGPHIEAFQDQKEKLVYLTADSENVFSELDPEAIGLADWNCGKE